MGQLWDLIAVLVKKEIKLRYRGTVFGIFWSLANPLALTLVLYIAFKRVLQVEIDDYPLFILSALFAWQWLANSLNAASSLFVFNAPLIKKFVFPRYALCFALVLGEMIHFVITLPVFAGLSYFTGTSGPGQAWIVGIPVLLSAQAALTLAGVIIVSTVNAFFRDLEQLLRVVLLLLFYLTPVLYPVSMVPDNLGWLLFLNPFSPLIISWRALLMENTLSSYMFVSAAYAILSLLIALPVYRKMEWRLPEVV